MYGLEKKKKEPFRFDLETEVKSNPMKAKDLQKEIDTKIHELKNLLREGAETEDFDEYGVLLHGYASLKRVFNRITSKK